MNELKIRKVVHGYCKSLVTEETDTGKAGPHAVSVGEC